MPCVLSVAFGASACRDAPAPTTRTVTSALAASSAAPVPADHLLPGELPEGKEIAYGLALPRGFVVDQRFEDAVHASGNGSPEHVSAFVRRRIQVSTVEVGPARTIFAAARSKTGVPITVEITDRDNRVELVVRDLTPPPVVPGLSEEERWRRAGLRPNGQPLDPNNTF